MIAWNAAVLACGCVLFGMWATWLLQNKRKLIKEKTKMRKYSVIIKGDGTGKDAKGLIVEAADVDVQEDNAGNPTYYNFLADKNYPSVTVAVFPYSIVFCVSSEEVKP